MCLHEGLLWGNAWLVQSNRPDPRRYLPDSSSGAKTRTGLSSRTLCAAVAPPARFMRPAVATGPRSTVTGGGGGGQLGLLRLKNKI